MEILHSKIDESVNFITKAPVGYFESRYVRKCDDYFIAYLSSQSGCNRGCKFCHLTTTGQTLFEDAESKDFIKQARAIFKHYKNQKLAKYMHYNFMARGEPLANTYLINYDSNIILVRLGSLAAEMGLPAKFNISTIIPATLNKSLVDVFPYITPTIYYSLYSVDTVWRKKWIPGAMPLGDSLKLLKEYQDFSKKIIKIHHPFIENENDSEEEVREMCSALLAHKIICEFNLVRYNPPDNTTKESSAKVISRNLSIIRNQFEFPTKVQIIPRVGFDVSASCGMFVSNAAGLS